MPPRKGNQELLSAASALAHPQRLVEIGGNPGVEGLAEQRQPQREHADVPEDPVPEERSLSRAHTPEGTGSFPGSPNRLSACETGSSSPIWRGVSLSKIVLMTSRTNIVSRRRRSTPDPPRASELPASSP